MKVGVVGFQGAVDEHIKITEKALRQMEIDGGAVWLETKKQLSEIDGLIIPGGESTTIGQLMLDSGIFKKVREKGKDGFPIMGTCAGMVLLAKKGGKEIKKTNQPLLELMDITVIRNSFGRQRESFETDIPIACLDKKPFPAIFIRAPAIIRISENVTPLARYKEKIVAAEQDNLLAVSFHPELTDDIRVHKYFLERIIQKID